ncbi:hypothetical protein PCASD_05926 [Puccinia coronata f. sp. avenae]|uniref:Uncharacterized protein n=1 Tax=Puccinia coronata f. sp. avenae TaxID=200324 RepID=A0A2N5V647_9BASI|nr:hypothetical protein PCASD_05926 [Puccinia coronata f. sp. avenae]
MSNQNGGSVPQRRGPQLDPEEAHDNGSGANVLVDCRPPQAPSMSEEGIQNLCAMTTLDDGGFNRALDIIRTPRAPIHFLVRREMERVILQDSERLNHPANTKPANHAVKPEPATPSRFIFSAVTKKDGTRNKSLLTITMQGLERLPKSTQEREYPPGYFHGNPAARKALLAQVREIQKRVRLSIRKKLLINMINADGNTIEDQVVPNVHKLTKSIFLFLNPAKVSMTQAQVREAILMLYVTRIGHLRLQTLQHLLSPGIKRVSQWDLINNKIQELNSKSSDYQAAGSKAIMAREALLFGQQRSFNELDEAVISIPTDEEVQAVLDKHQSQVAGPSSSTRQA